MDTTRPHQGSMESSSSNSSRKRKRPSNKVLLFRIAALFVLLWIIVCTFVMNYMFQGKATITQKFAWEDPITRARNNNNDNDNSRNSNSKHNVLPASVSESDVAKLPVRKPIAPMAYTQMVLTVPSWYNQQIRIQLRPDWSQGSVDYIHRLVQQQCATCSFFRIITNEKEQGEGILLGTLKNDMVPPNKQPGICPDIDKAKAKANCTDCECHGPILERGMVAWIGGTAGGPEFFVNLHNDPLTYVGYKHTIFGQVVDYESFDLLLQFLDEATSFKESQVFDDVIHFHLELE
jgi:cyclophilin family peptidyl-prolyl cis-trans isomerase